MSALRTLPASDAPRVVFLGYQPEFLDLVKHVYNTHEIEVLEVSYSEFLQLDTTSLDSNSVYKLIWWVDLKDIKTFRVLEKISSSPSLTSVVILGIVPEYLVPDYFSLEDSQKKLQKLWQNINKALPGAQIFWSRDLLTNFPPLSLEMVFAAIDKKMLLDLQLDLFLTDVSGYFKSISKSLVSPHESKKIVIQGKKRPSAGLIKTINNSFDQYFQRSFKVLLGLGKRITPDLSGFIKVTVDSASESSVDNLVRNFSKWKKDISKLPEKMNDFWKNSIKSNKSEKLKEPEEKVEKTEKKSKKPVKKIVLEKDEQDEQDIVESGLSNIFKKRREIDSSQRLKKKTKIVEKISEKSKKNKVLFAGGLGVMVAGGTILLMFIILKTSTFFARKEVVRSFETPQKLFQEGFKGGGWSNFLENQVNLYDSVIEGELLGSSQDLVGFYKQSKSLTDARGKLDANLANYVLGMIGTASPNVETLKSLETTLKETILENQKLEEKMIGINPEWFEEGQSNLENYETLISKEKKRLVALQQLSSLFKQIWGGEGKRTYALLLQNNLELRPTGGFIQAVALLTFNNELLIDTQIKSVYELDDRLPGKIDAPREIQKYLGEQNWYLRDGNWDADFPITAKRVAWFINESLGKSVDGIFAIDYLVMQAVLEALGPMELPEYQEIITSKNILERVEFHSDDELVSKKLKNKGYFLSLFDQFLNHVRTMTPDKNPAFGLALYDQLEKNSLLIEIFSDEEQTLFKKLGWNGEIVDPVCPPKFPGINCLVDQVYQVEANIGVNRVNDYIKREVKHEVDLAGDKVKHKRVITMTNQAKTDGWPLGTYRTYLKFIIDREAKPKSLKLNQQKITGQKILTYIENDRRVIGVSLEIPKEKTITIEIEYETEKITESPFSYLLFNQKQPGLEETPTVVSIYHEGYKPRLIAPSADIFGSTLEFNGAGEKHLFVGVSLE